MLPALPSRTTPELDELVVKVLSSSAALGRGIHPLVLDAIARLMLNVNSYYTNAMEGNPSKLADIEAALEKKFAKDAAKRNFQLKHVAHIQVQEAMAKRLRLEPSLRICSEEFLCWLHAEFFLRLPPELRFAKTVSGAPVPVEPGRLRDRPVTVGRLHGLGGGTSSGYPSVGRHHGPATKAEVKAHLADFNALLSPETLAGPRKLIGMAASHHRLLWVHPFPEGNGRVARLLSTAYGIRIGVGDSLLWTPVRAFARRRPEYDAHLAQADLPRRNDLDGRGPLSEECLIDFCAFFLRCCADQIEFMDGLLGLTDLSRRYKRFLDGLAAEKELSKGGAKVMGRIFLQGEVQRAEVLEICRVRQRRATQVAKELRDAKLTRSETAYGPLRLNITADMAAVLFPGLA